MSQDPYHLLPSLTTIPVLGAPEPSGLEHLGMNLGVLNGINDAYSDDTGAL